jgi:branched-chain amino acid transport system permease protein
MFLQQLVNGISVGGIYAMISIGYALIYSLLGFSNWAHGDVAMIGAYIGFLFFATAKLPFPIALIIAIVGAGLLSLLNERIAYRRIRKNNSPTMFLMIAAMGVSTILQNFITVTVGPKFLTYPTVVSVSTIKIGKLHIGVLDAVSLLVVLISIILLILLLNKTRFGLALKACASNIAVASILGINVDAYVMWVFFLAGSYAGLAGVLLGMKYTVYPQLGNVSLKAFIASVFGGLGSVPGAIIGGLFIGIMEGMITAFVNPGLRDIFTFSFLIIVLLIRPSGLFGKNVSQKA